MKIVVNRDWGGFEIPQELADKLVVSIYADIDRSAPELIEWVETHTEEESWPLVIREIPDNSFYVIADYDGIETIYYSSSEIKAI